MSFGTDVAKHPEKAVPSRLPRSRRTTWARPKRGFGERRGRQLALGLAERLVSRMSDDARWRVVTVYVIEFPRSADRRCVRLFFACDALDLCGPYLIQRDL